MSQETNLNVSPYFDDFDANKDYHKVLFKPSYPIQARELNTLQSILQNQVEQYGKHVFKEGSVVIPGQVRYNSQFYAIEVESTFNGAPISLYFDELLGKKLRGSESGVSAQVVYLLKNVDSERGNYTLYVNYLESGGENFTNRTFQSSETLLLEDSLTYGNTTIQSGQEILNTISNNATSIGSAVSVLSGVYFVRGFFVRVSEQTILLDQYSTFPSYKVGFNVIEDILTADEDSSLFDNAQGFSNYAAPGADRFKITLELSKKTIDDLETDNFVEIIRVENGIVQYVAERTQYNLIRDELARRTFDESGNYFISPFSLFVRDSLNDKVLSDGIYFKNQKTVQGNIPSEELMVYQIGPGKAYVNGYEVETISPRLIDVEKTRTTETIRNQTIPYNAGNLIIVNNCYGSPSIGLGTDATLSLMDSRIGESSTVSSGTTIGLARIYDFVPESDYVDDSSRLNLRLFDIQTYTKIGVSTSFSFNLTTPTFIEGKKSKATGYLKNNLSSGETELILYNTSGNFLENEQIIINGLDDGRLINSVKDYSISDIKSVYSKVGISTFNADLVLSSGFYIAKPGTTFKIENGVVSAGLQNVFTNVIKVGDIVSYANTTFSGDPIYNKVTNIGLGGTNFTITGITTVSGVCNGVLPTGSFEVTNIVKVTPSINTQNSLSSSLLTRLPSINVSSINLEGNEILQRRSYNISSFSGSTISVTIDPADTDIYFDSFDEDKFLITYSDGSIETMRADKYNISLDGKTLTFNGLSKSSGINAKLIATVKNLNLNSKTKKLNKVSSLIVSKSKYISSGIGTTTLNDGLEYSQIYGTRVQDKEISLNVPDVVRVLAVYESNGTSNPNLPILQITGNPSGNQKYVVGEQIEGERSGAVAIIVSKIDSDKLEYTYLNNIQFSLGEIVIGLESNEESIIIDKTLGDKNIVNNFALDDGQRNTFYDYSRLIKKSNVEEPKKRLKIIFQNYTIDSSDSGEIITANSYDVNNFKHDILYYQESRLTDYIDIRPRVAPYASSSKSPFEFDSRNFASDGQYSKYILAPGENLILSYSHYVGRIDRVFLNSDGRFEVVKGIASSNPLPPPLKSNSLDIATVFVPPYVFNTNNVTVDMSKHKRYRMSDISLLENRIKRVEEFTTLSMLESKTENFSIRDAETGLDRFKCGFFVDNFSSHKYHDLFDPSFKASIDTTTNTLRPLHYTTSIDLQLGSEAISGIAQTYSPNKDHSYVSDLGSPNVKKTGDLITLNYREVKYYEQLYATKSESVTPLLVVYWSGSIELNPPFDSWIEEKEVTSTSYTEVTNRIQRSDQNLTVVENVTVDTEVWVNPPITNTGVDTFDWIGNARSILPTLFITGGNISVSDRGISISSDVNRWNRSLQLQTTIRSAIGLNQVFDWSTLIPYDIAAQFAAAARNQQLQDGTWVSRVSLWFEPNRPPIITEDRDVTTTTESTSNLTTLIVPPEVITEDTLSESISHYTEKVRYLRSRNIEFDAKGLRPRTRFYSFFQGIDVKDYIIPKLLEVEMISGKFQIGETVETDPHFTTHKIRFRLCKPNHKTGPFNESTFLTTDVFELNPYTQQPIPDDYSESSTFLNVDTRALELSSEIDYYGSISLNMKLIGKTSGAVARISNVRLISDNSGRLIGSLYIPDPSIPSNPKWINGENTFTLIDNSNLDTLTQTTQQGIILSQSSAESKFSSASTANVKDTNILTTRNITILSGYNVNTTNITNTTTNTTTVTQTQIEQEERFRIGVALDRNVDPIAQSFFIPDDTGIFLTSVEVFFETKDDSVPVTLQIRPIVGGVPSNMVVPFSEVTLSPNEVNLSTDASVPTRFTFMSPVYLQGPQQSDVRQVAAGSQLSNEFCIVLLSNSPQYRVFISELGSNDIQTGVKLSQQPTLGSFFKSQNASTWSPSQLEDLKYRIYRADFVSEGLVRFFNPKLDVGNKKSTVTGSNQLLPLSKRIVVGLGSTGYNNSGISTGITIAQGSARGKLIGIAGSLTSTIISNIGVGYSNGTFTNVSLESETGYGTGAVATIGIVNSGISTVTITSGGFGYVEGDSLIIPEKEFGLNVGFGGKLTVSGVSSNKNAFILDNIQGNFVVGINSLSYINSSGSLVSTGATISSIINDSYYDGLHMKINHMNHGMHSDENYVRISEMRPLPNEINSRLSNSVTATQTTIPVVSSAGFETFEGVGVSTSNPGYVIIGYEVIQYTSVGANNLTVTQRGVDGTQAQPYDANVPVYKYEFNGISLRRINKVHNFAEVDTTNHPINLNSYFIKIDTSNTDFENNQIGIDRSNNLYFTQTAQTGRSGTVLTNNIQFESITPNISYLIPGKTNLSSRVRTFSGTSISGSEKSFTDLGFSSLPLTGQYYFDSPRIICSDINEQKFITESPGSKSFTMEFLMNTTDSRVSPIIDLVKVNAVLTSNLINSPVGINDDSDYANDDSVRSLYEDGHEAIYISKPVRLKIPANSIKVLLSASHTDMNDIRVLYRLFREDSANTSQNYELFPGYKNYQVDGQGIKRVIDKSQNDGSSDSKVTFSSDSSFRDYEYSVDDLPDFDEFSIKIVMSSKNQANPPFIKQLRAIATVKPKV